MANDSSSEPQTLVVGSSPVNVELDTSTLTDHAFSSRYSAGLLIGKGGMGEVRMCRDQRIGREVALKSISKEAQSPAVEHRFLREARVQAQLEHPSIVPVYDMGLMPDGQLYFTMKRVRGLTLDAVVRGLSYADPNVQSRFTLRRLLTAFNQACLAVDFAHQHGVLHRDLKPENIMVGDFGEVYVLDWGLAKISAADAQPLSLDPKATAKGAVMGTPGYMAPEQVLPTGELDARADVYALGAVLFELLTWEPLVSTQSNEPRELFAATLAGADGRASVRAPAREIPPELDAICVRATAVDPAARFGSARELSDALERFLDGDRDLELRKRMAADHARTAQGILSRANISADDRMACMSELGRALALDPGNATGMETFVRLLQVPMSEIPAEVEREVSQHQDRTLALVRRSGSLAYASFVLFLPLLVWMGVRDWGAVAAMMLFAAISTATSLFARSGKMFTALFYSTLITSTVAIGLSARLFGPFVLTASVAAVNVLGLCLIRPRRGAPWPLLASVGSAAVLVPAFLETMGWLSPSYLFDAGTITILPHMVDLRQVPTTLVLLLVSLAVIAFPAAVFGLTRSALDRAELELRVQAWHLRGLAPARPPER